MCFVPPGTEYLTLSRGVYLKDLEEPCLYNLLTDELYELNAEAREFLVACARGEVSLNLIPPEAMELVTYCLDERLLQQVPEPSPRQFVAEQAPVPSLRYLELQLTRSCNLRCRHCFLGASNKSELPWAILKDILDQFARAQGLRLILTGGEPLLYKSFWQLNEILPDYPLRSVLLTNGHLLSRQVIKNLKVHEVQVSLDGLEEAHDILRGAGSYRRVVKAIEDLRAENVDVSLATMIHRANLGDFPALARLADEWGIKEWNVDFPVETGNLAVNRSLAVDPAEAAPLLDYARGGGHFAAEGLYTCGAHLAAVNADGILTKCSFYPPETGFAAEDGLVRGWLKIPRLKPDQLDCNCSHLLECRGGCRYRAEKAWGPTAPDPVQCFRFGVPCGGEKSAKEVNCNEDR